MDVSSPTDQLSRQGRPKRVDVALLRAAAERVAAVTGETIDEVAARLGAEGLRRVPKRLSPTIPDLLATEIVETGVEDGLAYVLLPNGRRFFGYPSRPLHEKQCRALQGLLDDRILPECFLLALDVVYRYCSDASVPVDLLPRNGGLVVEAGAYLGHKAIRIHDALPDKSTKIVAIEMVPENCAIMRRNFAANGLDGAEVIQAGVWNEAASMQFHGHGRQRNTLVEGVDGGRLQNPLGIMARLDRLDALLESHVATYGAIDFMYMSVNGAEPEALEGLDGIVSKVKSLRIASHYKRGGRPIVSQIQRIVEDYGFALDARSRGGVVIATRPPHSG